jgi:hypothetical protein
MQSSVSAAKAHTSMHFEAHAVASPVYTAMLFITSVVMVHPRPIRSCTYSLKIQLSPKQDEHTIEYVVKFDRMFALHSMNGHGVVNAKNGGRARAM